MLRKRNSRFRRGIAAVLLSMLCWGTVPVFIKSLTGHMDAWTMNMYRYAVAAFVYLPFLVRYRLQGKLTAAVFLATLFPTAVNIGGQVFWTLSFYYLDAGIVALLVKISLVWATLLSFLFFADERVLMKKKSFWLGTYTAFGAVIGLSLTGLDVSKPADLAGIAVVILCSLFWGLYPVSVKTALRQADPVLSFSLICVNTAAGLLAAGWLRGDPAVVLSLPGKEVFILVLSAVVGIALSHISYYYALRSIGIILSSNVSMLTPFYTLVLSAVFLAERITPAKIGFGTIIISGLLLVSLARYRTLPRDEERAWG